MRSSFDNTLEVVSSRTEILQKMVGDVHVYAYNPAITTHCIQPLHFQSFAADILVICKEIDGFNRFTVSRIASICK